MCNGKAGKSQNNQSTQNAENDVALVTVILALIQLISFFSRMDTGESTGIAPAGYIGVRTVNTTTIKPGSWLRWRDNARADSGVTWDGSATCNKITKSTCKLVSILVTISGVFLHATKNNCLKSRVNVGVNQRWWLRSLVDLFHSNANGIIASKRHAASSSFVHDNAQGIDIGGWSQRLAGALFWRNVMCGTQNRVIGG